MDIGKLATEAEKEIAEILARFESESGTLIESIELQDTEVTTFTDDRPQWMRRVVVGWKRLPGTRWGN